VHLTRDGTLVAFHDARLDRVTDHIGAIAELGKADIEAADAGFAFSPDGGRALPCRGRGVRITRLEELLTRWPEARINTDPKIRPPRPSARGPPRSPGRVESCMHRLVHRSPLAAHPHTQPRLSMHLHGPARRRPCAPRRHQWADARQRGDCVQVPRHRGRIRIVTARFVRVAHRAGLPVHVWTVNDETTMRELLDPRRGRHHDRQLQLLRGVFASRSLEL
jgi:glycerophosphoryl diester phosphodiesterase